MTNSNGNDEQTGNREAAKLYAELCKLVKYERKIKVGDWVLWGDKQPDLIIECGEDEVYEGYTKVIGRVFWDDGGHWDRELNAFLLIPTSDDWDEIIIKAYDTLYPAQRVAYITEVDEGNYHHLTIEGEGDKHNIKVSGYSTALEARQALAGKLKKRLEDK